MNYVIEPLNGPPYASVLIDATLDDALEEAETKNWVWDLPVVVLEGTCKRRAVAIVDCDAPRYVDSCEIGRNFVHQAFGYSAEVVTLKPRS